MTIEERITKLEVKLEEIAKRFAFEEISAVDLYEFKHAVKEFSRGNKKPLERYKQAGKKIPLNNRGTTKCIPSR